MKWSEITSTDAPNLIMKSYEQIMRGRYGWYLKGLPDLARAKSLWKIRGKTMTTVERSVKLWDLCKKTLKNNVPGDFVECGVWKGGSAGLMGLALEAFDNTAARKLHLFDSFEGLPQPTVEDGERAAQYSGGVNSGELVSVHKCEASLEYVQSFLSNLLSLKSERLVYHEGWFQDTIPLLADEPKFIAVLRLDGDWYESTKICLDHLYDRVPTGGVVILDDYFNWEGCSKAVKEFRGVHGITDPVIQIDADSGYWIKGFNPSFSA